MASPVPHHACRTQPVRLLGALLVLLLTAFVTEAATAQVYRDWHDTTLVPEKRPFNHDAGAFTIGVYVYNYNLARPIVELWPAMDSLGMDYLLLKIEQRWRVWNRYDSLMRSPLRPANGRVIPMIAYDDSVYGQSRLAQVGRAQEVTFYPFDSSEMAAVVNAPYYGYHHIFRQVDDDVTAFNQHHIDTATDNAPRESIYDIADSGTVVASQIAYGWDSIELHRYPQYKAGAVWATPDKDSVIDAHMLLDEKKQPGSVYSIVVRGHLFTSGSAADTDSLLRINVWYEIAKGDTYQDSTNVSRIADTNLRFHYSSLFVSKQDLLPSDPLEPEWNEYREKLLPLDLNQCATCGMRGPLGAGNSSKRFDLEVIYLGKEKLALRSIGIRDSLTQLLMGTSPLAAAFRDSIRAEIDTLVLDPTTGQIRPALHSLYADGELHATQFAGFREIDKLAKAEYDLSAASPAHEIDCHDVVDLLSGTYYLRLRLDTSSLTAVARFGDMRYPIAEHASYVEAASASKRVARLDGEAGNGLRLSAQPNPFAEETEIRFSIPRGERIGLRVFDASGREVVALIDGEEMEHGRYAAALESANLANGSYIVELRVGEERITTQVVIQR